MRYVEMIKKIRCCSVLHILIMCITFSCQSEKEKHKEKIEDARESGNSRLLFDQAVEYINKYPDDSSTILLIYTDVYNKLFNADTSLFRQFNEKILEIKVSHHIHKKAIESICSYYYYYTIALDSTRKELGESSYYQNLKILNLYMKSFVNKNNLSDKNGYEYIFVTFNEKQDEIEKYEKANQVIFLATGYYEKGNSFVGSLYGRAAADLTTESLSVTYDVFSPISGNSNQYNEKGTISFTSFLPDNSNKDINVLIGKWNVENKPSNYGEFIIKLDNPLKNKRLYLIVKGQLGSNWQYQCYKDLDEQTFNSLKDLLKKVSTEKKNEIKLDQTIYLNQNHKLLSIDNLLLDQLRNMRNVSNYSKCDNNVYCNIVYEWSKLYDSIPSEFQNKIKFTSGDIYELKYGDFKSLTKGFSWNSHNMNLEAISDQINFEIGYNDPINSYRAGMVWHYINTQIIKN